MPRSLFTTSVASASPSTSSAMISIGRALLDGLLERRAGCPGRAQIFLSVMRMTGFSRTASIRSGLVTKYAEM